MALIRDGEARLAWAQRALILLLVVITDLPALRAVFVGDDRDAVLANPGITRLATSLWPPDDTSIAGRPLASLSLAVDYAIGGVEPWIYHLTNLALHALCAALAFELFRAIGRRLGGIHPWAAALAALWWAVHPIHHEVVTYAVARTESMMAAFLLGALLCWDRSADAPRPRVWIAGAAACFAAGMLCKEAMLLTPLFLLLYDRGFLSGSFRGALARVGWGGWAAATAPALLAAVTFGHRTRSVGFDLGVHPLDYLLTQTQVMVWYLRLALWPAGMNHHYEWDIVASLSDAAATLVAISGLGLAAAWALARRPALGFAGACWFLLLAPTSSVVPVVTEVAADRRMYLPLLAMVGAAGLGLRQARLPPRAQRLVGLIALAWALALAAVRAENIRAWSDPVELARRTLEHHPDHVGANSVVGIVTWETDRVAATAMLQRALAREPENPTVHAFLGWVAAEEGDHARAVAHYQIAVSGVTVPAYAHLGLAASLESLGRIESAIEHYRLALPDRPEEARAALERLSP